MSTFSITLLSLPFCILTTLCWSQSEENSDIEEQIITGERSTWAIRYQMLEAEDAVYDLYNEIYAGTNYELICNSSTTIKDAFTANRPSPLERNCATAFVHEQQQDALDEMIEADFFGSLDDYIDADMDSHAKELHDIIISMYEESPEFRAQLQKYQSLKRSLESSENQESSEGFFSRLFGS